MINRYVVGEKEKQSGWYFMQRGGEEQADMGGLHCHLGPCDIGAYTAT